MRDGEWAGLKFVIETRAGTDVTVVIAPESRKRAAMLYGQDEVNYGLPFDEGEQAVRYAAPFGLPRRGPDSDRVDC
jgi:hypothetical protein